MPRIDEPDGRVHERILDMLIEDLVKVVELPEHGTDERRPVMGSLGELSMQKMAKDPAVPRM